MRLPILIPMFLTLTPINAATGKFQMPEPTTSLMLVMGMLLMGLSFLRKRRVGGPK